MTQNEAIEIREKLLAEQRRLNAAVKVLESDTCPTNAGIRMAISQYKARISLIDEEIREFADQIEPEVQKSRSMSVVLIRQMKLSPCSTSWFRTWQ